MKTLLIPARSLHWKPIAARLLLWLLPFTLTAVVQAQFTYGITNGIVTIKGYSGPEGPVTIPDTIDGLPVKVIGNFAFSYRDKVTAVMIPGSVTTIGNYSFYACTSLTNISVDAANPVYSSVRGVLFDKARTKLVRFPEGLGGGYIIPSHATSIGDAAFIACAGMTSVTIPNGVTTLGSSVFSGCTGLTSVSIPDSVVSLGALAFAGCAGLGSVTIPNSITNLSNLAFGNCIGLSNVTIGNSVTSIGYGVFSGCSGLSSVTIPNGVTTFWDSAFNGCTSLTSIAIPNTVTSLGAEAFKDCTSLTNVTIPNSVTSLGSSAFRGCTGLTSVTIPNSITSINAWTFADCTSLTGVSFQGNAPKLDWRGVFEGSDQVTVYYLPGTTGWDPTFSGRPTALWSLPYPVILGSGPGFGATANGFGFLISWATNASVVVEASPARPSPVWIPVSTNTLTSGTSQFIDPQWTNHPAHLYRLVAP